MIEAEMKLVSRTRELFLEDFDRHEHFLLEAAKKKRFLVIGGAGSIGQAVVKEILKREPMALHVVDLNENNLVELVRDVHSSTEGIAGDFRTFVVDCGDSVFEALYKHEGPYDYVMNLSALKHVRSEKDPYSLMRLVEVNILNVVKMLEVTAGSGVKRFFSVSSDKAVNPVSMMGASKRIMEMLLAHKADDVSTTTARFANVAFSDGSLLQGFTMRIRKEQPIAAPRDIKRYFMSPREAGRLCLFSCLLGDNADVFFPKISDELKLTLVSDIAREYLRMLGYEPVSCLTEDEARRSVARLKKEKKWPCYFSESDTTGEKTFEEFLTEDEEPDMERFKDIGVIQNQSRRLNSRLLAFLESVMELKKRGYWSRQDIIELFVTMVGNLKHHETGKYLDSRM